MRVTRDQTGSCWDPHVLRPDDPKHRRSRETSLPGLVQEAEPGYKLCASDSGSQIKGGWRPRPTRPLTSSSQVSQRPSSAQPPQGSHMHTQGIITNDPQKVAGRLCIHPFVYSLDIQEISTKCNPVAGDRDLTLKPNQATPEFTLKQQNFQPSEGERC